MSRYFNINGVWHAGGHAWIFLNGAWHAIGNIWININGAWHALYSYTWQVGAWGGCSVTCGGGVQYRDVVCMRSDGWNGNWEGYCTTYVGAKPPTSQACNTQSCVSCRYTMNNCSIEQATCVGVIYMGGCGSFSECWNFTLYNQHICTLDCTYGYVSVHCSRTCGDYYVGAFREQQGSFSIYELCGPF